MGPGLKVLSQSSNIGSGSSVAAVVAVDTARFGKVYLFVLDLSASSIFSTIDLEALQRNQPTRLPGLKPGMPSTRAQAEGLSLPAGRQGLILHFDKLSVLSLPKEAALLTPV